MVEGYCRFCKKFIETSNYRKRCCKYHKELHSELAYGYNCFESKYDKEIICENCKHLEGNKCRSPEDNELYVVTDPNNKRGCYQWEEGEDKNTCYNCRYLSTDNKEFRVCNNKTVLDNIPKGYNKSFNADDPDCGQWRPKLYCRDCKWNDSKCRAEETYGKVIWENRKRYDNSCSLWFHKRVTIVNLDNKEPINKSLLEETRKLFE